MIKYINNQIVIEFTNQELNFVNYYDVNDIVSYQTLSGNKIDFNNLSDITYLNFSKKGIYDTNIILSLHLKECKLHSLTDFAYKYNSNYHDIERYYINDKYIHTEENYIIKSKLYNRNEKLKTLLS